jgi:hypothetical protein
MGHFNIVISYYYNDRYAYLSLSPYIIITLSHCDNFDVVEYIICMKHKKNPHDK